MLARAGASTQPAITEALLSQDACNLTLHAFCFNTCQLILPPLPATVDVCLRLFKYSRFACTPPLSLARGSYLPHCVETHAHTHAHTHTYIHILLLGFRALEAACRKRLTRARKLCIMLPQPAVLQGICRVHRKSEANLPTHFHSTIDQRQAATVHLKLTASSLSQVDSLSAAYRRPKSYSLCLSLPTMSGVSRNVRRPFVCSTLLSFTRCFMYFSRPSCLSLMSAGDSDPKYFLGGNSGSC